MCPNSNDPNSDQEFLKWLTEWASTHSDGCTKITQLHQHCCWQHDYGYQTGFQARSVWSGNPIVISRKETDVEFRQCNESEDPLGRFSPLAWWRYAGVRLFGRFFYKKPKIKTEIEVK